MNANFVKNQRIIRPTTHHTSPANGIWTDTQRSQICKLQILLGFLDAREHLRTDVGGGSGIRTHVTVSRKHAFQACAFSHSATPPNFSTAHPFYMRTRRVRVALPRGCRPDRKPNSRIRLRDQGTSHAPAQLLRLNAPSRKAARGAHYNHGQLADNSSPPRSHVSLPTA